MNYLSMKVLVDFPIRSTSIIDLFINVLLIFQFILKYNQLILIIINIYKCVIRPLSLSFNINDKISLKLTIKEN